MRRTFLLFMTALVWAGAANLCAAGGPRIWIVKDGKPVADVYAGPTEWETAERFTGRIEQWTGVKLAIFGTSEPPANRRWMARVLIGTPRSFPEIARQVGKEIEDQKLGDEGYVLRATAEPALVTPDTRTR